MRRKKPRAVNPERLYRRAQQVSEGSIAVGTHQRDQFSIERSASRKAAIERWFREGGQYFADWSEAHYRRPPDGIPIAWSEPYLKPFYLAFGNPWLEYLICQKPAQVYFSESLVNLCAFALTIGVPVGFGFERESKLRDMVGPRIQTAFDFVEPIRELKRRRQELTGRADTDLKSRVMTIGGVTSTFFYASTSKKAGGSERQASSSISSWPGYVMLCDEVELWPEGVIDVAKSRQLSFNPPDYPTRPFRAGSTPGHEGGVTDREIKAADCFFQWRVVCPHCGEAQCLDVFGNFLKPEPTDDGDRYLTATGRPIDWFAHDSTNRRTKQRTAYVGCRHCGGELDWETRAAGEYWCTYTDRPMLPLLDQLCQDRTPIRRAAIEITPLSSSRFLAPETILALFRSRNPSDTIQQMLGKAVSIGSGKIQLPTVQAAIARPMPAWENTDRTLVVIGADQGREGHWAVATRWHLPIAADHETAWRDAFVEVIDHGRLHGFAGLESWRRQHAADLVGIDNEPEVTLAADYARQRTEDLQPRSADKYRPLPDGSYRVAIAQFHPELINVLARQGWSLVDAWSLPDGDAHYRLVPHPQLAEPIKVVTRPLERGFGLKMLDAIDRRPERRAIYLFDQVALRGEPFRRTTRNVQGDEVPVWAIDRTYALDAVRDRLGRGLLSLPDGLVYNPNDNENLMLHLITSDRQSNGQWVESPGQPDHYFHALCFAEMAVLCSAHEPRKGSGLALQSLGDR